MHLKRTITNDHVKFSIPWYKHSSKTTTLEAQTMINMVETGFIPACAKDLKKCDNMSSKIAEPRKVAYDAIVDEPLACKL